MELHVTARFLRRWWWLIVIPTLISTLAALPVLDQAGSASGGFTTVLHYSAARNPGAELPPGSTMQDVWLASELTVNALSAWVRTDSFRREIDDAPGVNEGDTDALSIAADNQRSVGQIILNHPDDQALGRLAAAAIHVLQTRNRHYFPQFRDEAASVILLDTPAIVPAPAPLGQRVAPLLRIAAGLLAGRVLAMLAHTVDPTLREREDVEALGLAVLATLPRDRLR